MFVFSHIELEKQLNECINVSINQIKILNSALLPSNFTDLFLNIRKIKTKNYEINYKLHIYKQTIIIFFINFSNDSMIFNSCFS